MGVGIIKENVDSEILEYLKDKYNQDFTIKEMNTKVDPDKGAYELAVCTKKDSVEKFFTYYYYDEFSVDLESDTDEPDLTYKEGNNHVIEDTYGNNIIGNEYADYLKAKCEKKINVVCDMVFFDYNLTKDDIEKPFEDSVKNWKDSAYPNIYVFYCDASLRKIVNDEIKNALEASKIHKQAAYVCCIKDDAKKEAIDTFYDNKDDFEEYLENNKYIEIMDHFIVTENDGVYVEETMKEK